MNTKNPDRNRKPKTSYDNKGRDREPLEKLWSTTHTKPNNIDMKSTLPPKPNNIAMKYTMPPISNNIGMKPKLLPKPNNIPMQQTVPTNMQGIQAKISPVAKKIESHTANNRPH